LNEEAREKIEQMKEEELARLIKILGWYALKESRRKFFRTGRGGEMPGGYDVETVVNEAFTRVLTGQRRWAPEREPDLKRHLMDVIDSILYHLATGKDNELMRAAGAAEGVEDDSSWEAGSKECRPEREWLARGAQTADAALFERERLLEEERVLQMLVEECSGDPVLPHMLCVMREHDAEPAGISEITGLPVKDIYNAMKRLDRKIVLIRKRLSVNN
jgi:hypothetical protein